VQQTLSVADCMPLTDWTRGRVGQDTTKWRKRRKTRWRKGEQKCE